MNRFARDLRKWNVRVLLSSQIPANFLRRRKRREPSPVRRKRAAMLMVVAILGIQAVVTAPQALAAECGAALNPERPGSGMVGAIDPPRQHGLEGSAYLEYSYAGMVWHVFETNCSPIAGLTDPDSTIDTWGGNQLFNIAKNISTQLGPATGYFTGEDGSRTGAGFLGFLQSLVYSLFQLFAKAAVLLAQVILRLFTLTAPLIGLVAILHHDILRRVAKVLGAVAFNLIVLSVLAGVHALLLQAIFDAGNSLSMLVQMAMASLVTMAS